LGKFSTAFFNPVAKLLGNLAQTLACDSLALTISVEETDHPFGLLEGLDQAVE